ncbi:MAG: DNA double-strand break repair nuclease NurA [Actinomycetota bacterium]
MLVLKADPWRPDFGAGAETPFDDDLSKVVVDPFVESKDWSRGLEPDPCPPDPVTFVDGVMRTELRVLASDGDERAWGLLGSYAAGAVRCDGAATIVAEDEPVGRALVLGSRIPAEPISITVGKASLTYQPVGSPVDTPQALRTRLQRLMLRAEQELAAKLAQECLVFADGPLHLDGNGGGTVVGVVKRMVMTYLEGEPAALLPKLQPGQRTPLFALGNSVIDRYSWYLRLLPQERNWHEFAGLVRCEVRMSLGLENAAAIADEVTCLLPSFAGRPGIDPRAPQNVTPVGALEARLKHRLGSSTVISRALQAHLSKGIGDV